MAWSSTDNPFLAAPPPAESMYNVQPGSFRPMAGSSYGDMGTVRNWGAHGYFGTPDEDMYRTQIGQSYGLSGASRGRQSAMLDYLSALAEGKLGGKSLSQQAQEQSLSQIQAQSTAAARAGASPAERRMASYQGAAAAQQAAGRGALSSMQEQQAAQQAVLQGAGQMRGQDIQQAMAAQQGMLQATQGEGLRKQMEAKFLQLGLDDRESRRRANMAMEAMRLQAFEGSAGRQSAKDLLEYQMRQQLWQSLLGGGIAAGGSALGALAASDERVKTDIAPEDDVMGRYLDDRLLMANPEYGSVSGLSAVRQPSPEELRQAQLDIAVDNQKRAAATDSQKHAGGGKIAANAFQQLGREVQSGGRGSTPVGIQLAEAARERNEARTKQLFQSIMNEEPMLAAAAAVSDEREKEDVQMIEDFMDALQAYRYRYRNPERHGRGERLGVMAQDVENSDLGRRAGLVVENDGVKMLDTDPRKTYPVILAAMADLNERMNRLEGEEE